MKIVSRNKFKLKIIFVIFLFAFGYCNAKAQPSLLPLPQSVQWKNENFLLNQCKSILISDNSLLKSAQYLQEILAQSGINAKVDFNVTERIFLSSN